MRWASVKRGKNKTEAERKNPARRLYDIDFVFIA
jgi:hypothetical protein